MTKTTEQERDHGTADDGQREEQLNDAMGWVMDMAYSDQDSYLLIGDPHLDYGKEWPEVATQRAAWCRAIADASFIPGELDRWTNLAQRYEDSIA